MGNPLCHFELSVSDPEKSQAFYENVFDWKFSHDRSMDYTMINPGGEPMGGMMKKPDQAPGFSLSVYFCVDSLDETIAKVQAAGGTVAVPKTEIQGMGFWALFLDPDGIPVGVYESSK